MSWREVTAIVWTGFALGALTDTALRWRAQPGEAFAPPAPDVTVASRPEPDVNADIRRPAPAEKHDTERAATAAKTSEPRAIATTGLSADTAVDILRHRDLEIPVEGVHRKDLRDTFTETRSGSRAHEALDILAPRRTPVKAVEDGTIEKLFTSKAGGLTIYQFDPTQTFSYYYAHLDSYAAGVHEGQRVKKDDVIGYVGSTGNASPDAPHLHFAIFRLTPERKWWKGEPIDPFPVFK